MCEKAAILQCSCGRIAVAAIEAEALPIVSNDAPFGRHLCHRCNDKHRQYKAEQLAEWLEYFKPRVRECPLPHTARLKERLNKATS